MRCYKIKVTFKAEQILGVIMADLELDTTLPFNESGSQLTCHMSDTLRIFCTKLARNWPLSRDILRHLTIVCVT